MQQPSCEEKPICLDRYGRIERRDANLFRVALAFWLHLEVAQVGISMNFLQENA
jgi:hypothetical protein